MSPQKRNIFENILACESRDPVLLIHEKTRGQKSHATVPLRILLIEKKLLNFEWTLSSKFFIEDMLKMKSSYEQESFICSAQARVIPA